VEEAAKRMPQVIEIMKILPNDKVRLKELKRLAEIRGERPNFLFPEPVTTVEPQSSELDPRAESTIYTLLAVLLKAQGYSLDDKAMAGRFRKLIELEGVGISDKTIRKHVKKATTHWEEKGNKPLFPFCLGYSPTAFRKSILFAPRRQSNATESSP